jgi:hypothetical protein
MTADKPVDLTPYVKEIFTQVADELRSRLSMDIDELSEADQLAINTAVMKAAWRGALRGLAIYEQALNEASPETSYQTWVHRPEGDEDDPWTDEYGEGQGGDV